MTVLRNCSIALAAFAGCLLMIVCDGVAKADDCSALFAAMNKVITMPTHLYSTEVAGYNKNVPENSEMIYSGGSIYILVKGKWTRSTMTSAQMVAQQQENERTQKATCQHVRDESVNGEAASVYQAHTDSDGDKSDATVWVSKSRGVPLKEEVDLDVGGAAGKSHRTVRFDYNNVKPPM
jgi:outer membrane lipoprotein-sorting protein